MPVNYLSTYLMLLVRTIPLGPDRILLRGAMLRNTSWVFGMVIYTGHETKLMKNATSAPLKRSTVDRMTNTQVLMLFFLLIVLCLLSAICNELWTKGHTAHWYLGIDGNLYIFIPKIDFTFMLCFIVKKCQQDMVYF